MKINPIETALVIGLVLCAGMVALPLFDALPAPGCSADHIASLSHIGDNWKDARRLADGSWCVRY